MARVVNEEEYANKRKEILDITQRLVYTKGYEQMAIQDILDGLQISKGAFYHYFESKPALLDGLIDRMLEDVQKVLDPIVHAPDVPAIEKLRRYFGTAAGWKTANKPLVLSMVRVWYTDHNAIVRQKQQSRLIKQIAPFITAIIFQGVEEGAFTTAYPDLASEMVFGLVLRLGDTWAELLLANDEGLGLLPRLERMVAAYTDALERVLGAPSGSLHFMDSDTVKEWVTLPRDGGGHNGGKGGNAN